MKTKVLEMGVMYSCLQGVRGFNWLTSNPLINIPEGTTPNEDQPKVYSWDLKKTDLSEFIFENLDQQEVCKLPGSYRLKP